MKEFGFTCSCLKNTNTVISSTETNWAAIRKNSFIVLGNDSEFYTVGDVQEIRVIKDFTSISPNTVKILGNNCPLFLKNDSLEISFKEFEVDDILGIFSSGTGYSQGDILTLNGGIPFFDLSSNTTEPATFSVVLVDGNGSITSIVSLNRGNYIESPHQTSALGGGSGKNAGLNLSYKVSDKRRVIERVVEEVTYHPEQTVIRLNYDLNSEIKKGKVNLSKWQISLTSNYVGESKMDSSYKVLRDFTPHLGLPLISKNSLSFDQLYNKGIQIIDGRIKSIEERLAKIGV